MTRGKIISLAALGAILLALPITGTVKVYRIPTNQMSPTIEAGDSLLASRILNPAKSVKRGDVVIFNPPSAVAKPGTKYVQRVVAVGGDRIEQKDGQLLVNGVALSERAGKRSRPAKGFMPGVPAVTYPLVVSKGWIFTLGDNYENSLDSRYFGPFPVNAVSHSPDGILLPPGRSGRLK